MTIGAPGKNDVRISDLKEVQEIIDVFYKHGHRETDTFAYMQKEPQNLLVLQSDF